MTPILSRLGILLLGVFICAGLVLAAMYPYRPQDVLGWSILLAASTPVVLGLEFIASKAAARNIAYGATVIVAIAISILTSWLWLEPHLCKW